MDNESEIKMFWTMVRRLTGNGPGHYDIDLSPLTAGELERMRAVLHDVRASADDRMRAKAAREFKVAL